MSTSVGDLSVNISTNIASLETGMAKAADIVGRAARDMSKQFEDFNSRIGSLFSSLGALGSIAVAGLSAKVFADFITGTIAATENMGRMALMVGTTAEKLSMLVPAATLSGTAMDQVASAADKFSKRMALAIDPTSKSAAALDAIGLSAKDAAEFLKEPIEGMRKVALALDTFADDGNKAAIVMELYGKSGAELLPFLKELAQQQDLVATMTNEQARAAKELTDAWRTLQIQSSILKTKLVSEITPSLTALLDAFVKATTGSDSLKAKIGELIATGEVASWAQRAAIGLATMADGATNLINLFKSLLYSVGFVIESLKALATASAGVGLMMSGDLVNGMTLVRKAGADIAVAFNDMRKQWATPPSTKFQDSVTSSIINLQMHAGAVKDGTKPHADFQAALAKSAKVAVDLTSALEAYQKALAAVAKASADAVAKIQLEAISIGQEQVKRLYDQGIIDFKQFWDSKTALQKLALDVQEKNLSDVVNTQQTLVQGLQQTLNNLDVSKYKSTAEYLKAVYEASVKVYDAIVAETKARADLNVNMQKSAEVGKDYIKELIAESNGHLQSIKDLDGLIVKRIDENAAIGLTQSQVIALNIARTEEMRLNADLSGPNGAALLQQYDDQIDRFKKLAVATSAGENKARLVAGWQDLFKGAADAGAKFLTDFVQHGGSAFKNLWNDFKAWALEALAKIAAQKIIVSIAGSLGLGGIAQNALAGSGGPLGSLLGGGAPGGGFGGLNDIFGGLSSSFSSLTDLLTGNFGNLVTSASVTTEALVAGTAGIGSFTGALMGALPVLGLIGLALPLLSGLFHKGGGPKEGGTAGADFYPGETSAANNAKIQATVDTISTQFLTALKSLGGKGAAAFALGYDTDPQGTAQSRVSSSVTVDGRSVYGARDVNAGRDDASLQAALTLEAQRVVLAALKASQLPADIAKLFDSIDVGTASGAQIAAIEKTAATYALINDAITSLPSDVHDHFTAMLDGTQQMADNVLVVVSIIKTFGDSVAGLGPKLEALDPTAIAAFVDVLGGAAKAAASFAYLGQNFTTSSDKMKMAVEALNADFTKLGVTAIPQTHKQFLDLLNSFDLTTDSGRQLYASVLDLSSAFVSVHGTADAAAQALNAMTASATDFFKKNFYSAAEQAAQKYAEDLKKVADAQTALGIAIPTSVAGFRALIEGIDQSTDAGKALYAALIVLAPTIFDLGNAATQAAAVIVNAVTTIGTIEPPDYLTAIQNRVDAFFANIANLAKELPHSDLGGQLALEIDLVGKKMASLRAGIAADLDRGDLFGAQTLQIELAAMISGNTLLVAQLAEFTTLSAQYGSAMATQLINLEDWYKQQQAALAGNGDALAALALIFQQRWTDIINGVSTGVDGAISQLDRLRKSIGDYLKSLRISDISPLTPGQKLAQAKSQFESDFAKAQGGDLQAMGRLIAESDAYIKLARDAYASSQQYTDIFNLITTKLAGLIAPHPPTDKGIDPVVDNFKAAVDVFATAVDQLVGRPPPDRAPVDLGAAKQGFDAALPANGSKLASQEGIDAALAAQTAAIIEAIAARADAGSEDASAIKRAVERSAVMVADAVNSGLK